MLKSTTRGALISAGVLVVLAGQLAAQFSPPRVVAVINPTDTGTADGISGVRNCFIDRGLMTNISRGDVLNVYREKRLSAAIPRPMRLFIGTIVITNSQPTSSVGDFTPNEAAISHSLIRHKTAMKGDLVMPRLVIDSGVLFDPGKADLKSGAEEEFQKVADFVQMFTPSKLIIEGHTDSDGASAANQALSLKRARIVEQYLVTAYDFITPAMLEARGYGEQRPVVNNETPENKSLNRRIEVLVWE